MRQGEKALKISKAYYRLKVFDAGAIQASHFIASRLYLIKYLIPAKLFARACFFQST